MGGTGVAPEKPPGEDRGIGGTGVIGTIRRFGSIVVNDLRITFPRSVKVLIDGRGAALKDLKLGHVVQVLADPQGDRLTTKAILAFSEVVGPVEALDRGRMVVLGQHIHLPAPPARGRALRRGDFVAVSGLRRIDGVIVASLIERRPRGAVRLAGPSSQDLDGTLRVGGLRVVGLDPGLAGKRVAVMGHLDRGVLKIAQTMADPFTGPDAAARLSIEAYVAYERDVLRLGSGLSLVEENGALASVAETDQPVRAIVSANVEPNGALSLQSLQVMSDGRDTHGRDAHGTGHTGPGTPGGTATPGMGPPGVGTEPHGMDGLGPPRSGGFGNPPGGLGSPSGPMGHGDPGGFGGPPGGGKP